SPEVQDPPIAACNDAITPGISGQRNGANGSSCTAAILSRRCLTWVKSGRTHLEQMLSALPPIADMTAACEFNDSLLRRQQVSQQANGILSKIRQNARSI